MGFLKNPLLDP